MWTIKLASIRFWWDIICVSFRSVMRICVLYFSPHIGICSTLISFWPIPNNSKLYITRDALADNQQNRSYSIFLFAWLPRLLRLLQLLIQWRACFVLYLLQAEKSKMATKCFIKSQIYSNGIKHQIYTYRTFNIHICTCFLYNFFYTRVV